MESRIPSKRIALVAINIDMRSKNYKRYLRLSPSSKIDFIAAHISQVCQELEKREPNSKIVITWRENAIVNNKNEKAVNIEFIPYFKNAMQEVIKKFNHLNLRIVTGGMAIFKKVPKKKLTKYIERYQSNDELLNRVTKAEEEQVAQQHLSESYLQLKWHSDVTQAVNESSNKKAHATYISSMTFEGDEIQETRKVAPFLETEGNKHLSPIVYEPTKRKYYHPVFFAKGKSENITHATGVEICRENVLGILASHESTPLIHILNSDSTPIAFENTKAPYLLHVDSRFDTGLVKIVENFLNHPQAEQCDVVLYTTELLDEFKLAGPSQPITPFAYQIMTLANQIAPEKSKDPATEKALKTLKKTICDVVNKSDDIILNTTTKQIDNYRNLFYKGKISPNAATEDLVDGLDIVCLGKKSQMADAVQSTHKKTI